MKLKTLAALCKKKGIFKLCDKSGADGETIEQWLGTTTALYPLSGIPQLTEENLIALFDITQKQRGKMIIRHEKLPEVLNF